MDHCWLRSRYSWCVI